MLALLQRFAGDAYPLPHFVISITTNAICCENGASFFIEIKLCNSAHLIWF